MLFRLACLCFLVSICGGCGNVVPRTHFSYGAFGFSFEDTKNNDVAIKNFKRDPASGVVSFDELTVRNNSSDVMTANVAQMQKLNEQFIIHGENLNRMLGTLTSVLPSILPGVSVNGPLGGSATISGGALESLAKQLVPLLRKELATPQPVGPVE